MDLMLFILSLLLTYQMALSWLTSKKYITRDKINDCLSANRIFRDPDIDRSLINCAIDDCEGTKYRTFNTRDEYKNSSSYHPDSIGYSGNYVNFTTFDVKTLTKDTLSLGPLKPKNVTNDTLMIDEDDLASESKIKDVEPLPIKRVEFSKTELSDLPHTLYIIGLDISGKGIRTIMPEAFDEMYCLNRLDLSKNMLKEIPTLAFQGLTNLKVLNLSHNKLPEIHKDTFMCVVNLEILDLESNLITYLESSTFNYMEKIRNVNLSKNRISKIVYRFSQSFSNVLLNFNVLDLEDNFLTLVTPGMFANFRYLEILNLAKNRILEFKITPGFMFRHLISMNLSGNRLSDFDAVGFRNTFVNYNLRIDLNDNDFPCLTIHNLLPRLEGLKISFVLQKSYDSGFHKYLYRCKMEDEPVTNYTIEESSLLKQIGKEAAPVSESPIDVQSFVEKLTSEVSETYGTLRLLMGAISAVLIIMIPVIFYIFGECDLRKVCRRKRRNSPQRRPGIQYGPCYQISK
ncbi:toll-like receptor 7 isoform X1 [Sitophilus oryzae]|uniref:Toll-like receptor 7 isoform X1 n=1 Tax=Sitophilus oryzae TaxID=7048 RepID=A0A6J2XH37_SITOR|nr:toll-like receptor 7 isoform X1 [Sitophilus oryzae]